MVASKKNPAETFLSTHAWKNANIQLDGEEHAACFFDWYALSAEDDVKIEKGKALPEDQQDSYFGHVQLWTADFDQYFVGEHAETIEEGKWLPIAVIGMGNATTLENFAEMNNEGFLAIVLSGEGKHGSVVWYSEDEDEIRVVADSVDALEVELVTDDDDASADDADDE